MGKKLIANALVHGVPVREYEGPGDDDFHDYVQVVAAHDRTHAVLLLKQDGFNVVGPAKCIGQRPIVPTGEDFQIQRSDKEMVNLDDRERVICEVDPRSAQGDWLYSLNIERTHKAEDKLRAERGFDDYPDQPGDGDGDGDGYDHPEAFADHDDL